MEIELSFGDVERALMRLHGVGSEARRVTLRSRLQHLQRADFPPGVQVGRGRKFVYGFDRFFQLVFALELAVARVPPVHAARIVLANWPAMKRFASDAHAMHEAGAAAQVGASDRWALIVLRGLDTLRPDVTAEVVETVQEVPAEVIAGWMLGASRAPAGPLLILDLIDVARRALQSVEPLAVVA